MREEGSGKRGVGRRSVKRGVGKGEWEGGVERGEWEDWSGKGGMGSGNTGVEILEGDRGVGP